MTIDLKTVKHISKLSRISIEDEKAKKLSNDLNSIFKFIEKLKSNNIECKDIKIKLLCYPRILGYVFNPLSIFFVYDNNSSLVSILYEVCYFK